MGLETQNSSQSARRMPLQPQTSIFPQNRPIPGRTRSGTYTSWVADVRSFGCAQTGHGGSGWLESVGR
jgi:hypothetical protein